MMTRTWRRVAPWLLPTLVALEATLVFTGWISFGTAVWTVIAMESLLLITAISRMVTAARRFRNIRAEGLDRWRAAEDGLAELVPHKMAKAILIEPRMLACIGTWMRASLGSSSPRGDEAFQYGAQLRLFAVVLVVLVLVEGAVVDLILVVTLPGTAWIWVTLGLHVYGAVWLLGFVASMSTRPHLLTDTSLVVRDSIFNEVTVPYDAILGAAQSRHPNFGRSGVKLAPNNESAVVAYGEANIEITLDPSIPIEGLNDAHAPIRTLRISAEAPAAPIRALRQRQSPRRSPTRSASGSDSAEA